jgi:carbon storage regulator CsrA
VLVLTCKIDEAIWLDDEVQLVVLSNRGKRVRLGIIAPPTVRVERENVRKRIAESKRHGLKNKEVSEDDSEVLHTRKKT